MRQKLIFERWFLFIIIVVLFFILAPAKTQAANCCICRYGIGNQKGKVESCWEKVNKPCSTYEDPLMGTKCYESLGSCASTHECAGYIKTQEKETPFVPPELQVPIPGLKLTTEEKELKICTECVGDALECTEQAELCPKEKGCECKNWAYRIPWIGEYLAALYKWAVGALAILAVVMIMISGVQWIMAGGSPDKISKAKQGISAALLGLVLVLLAHQILSLIDPRLTIFKPIVIGIIKKIPYELAEGDPGQLQQEKTTKKPAVRTDADIKRIFVHYTSSDFGDVAQIRKWHTDKGYADIGYHYLILNGYRKKGSYNANDDGLVEKGRDELKIGAQAKGCNSDSIGISFVGNIKNKSFKENLEKNESMSSKQLDNLVKLINGLRSKYNIPVEQVFGHRECVTSSTDCPGFKDLGDFREYLKTH